MENIQPAPEYICSISKLSSLPLDDIHFEGGEEKATFKHAFKHIFISTGAKHEQIYHDNEVDLIENDQRQYLDAEYLLKIGLAYITHLLFLHVLLPIWIEFSLS